MRNLLLLLTLIGVVSSVQAQRTINEGTTKTSAGRWALGVETDNLLLIKKVAGPGDDWYLRKITPISLIGQTGEAFCVLKPLTISRQKVGLIKWSVPQPMSL